MKLISRKEFGETDKGYVFVMHFRGTEQAEADGGGVPERFEVRHGAHTIGVFERENQAEQVARALVGARAVA